MKLRVPLALLAALVVGLGLYGILSRRADPPLGEGGTFVNYERYDYRRPEGARVVHVGSIPTGVSSLFTVQSLFRDEVLHGQLAAHGWRLKGFGYRSGRDVLPHGDGRLDVLVVGDMEALQVAQRFHAGIYALVRQGTNAIIASRRITPSELKGLRIGSTPGTTSHFTLERALEAVGLTMADIVSVPMSPDEMEAALRSGRVDAVSTLEPFISIILSQVPGSAAIASSDSCTYLLANPDFAGRHPEVLNALLAAVVRAARWGRQGDENLRTALGWIRQENLHFAGRSSVEPSALWLGVLHRETIDNASFPMLPLNAREDSSLQHRQFEYLRRVGLIPEAAQWRELRERFRLELLPEVIRHGSAWKIDHFRYAPDSLYRDGAVPR